MTAVSRTNGAARSAPTRRGGLAPPGSATRFCTAHDELLDHLRSRTRVNEAISLTKQRRPFQDR